MVYGGGLLTIDKKLYKKIIVAVTNRLLISFAVVILGFSFLVRRLFDLQIVNGESYAANIQTTVRRTVSIPAMRGEIYDRFGRPLAINKTTFSIKCDPGVQVDDMNAVIHRMLKTLKNDNNSYIDELSITKDRPYEFTFSSINAEERWKKDMGMEDEQLQYTAEEAIEYLKELFKIPADLSESDIRDTPYDNPQIAVVVMIPFGESKESPAPKIAKEIFSEYFGLNAEPQKYVNNNTLVP